MNKMLQVQQMPRQNSGHPLLIIGIVIGVLFGLIACLPPKLRGFVVLGILAGIVWLFWTSNHDQAAAQAYVAPPARAQHYSDYAPRAELVRLPNK
jgi:predicted alpha/beta hydrolase